MEWLVPRAHWIPGQISELPIFRYNHHKILNQLQNINYIKHWKWENERVYAKRIMVNNGVNLSKQPRKLKSKENSSKSKAH